MPCPTGRNLENQPYVATIKKGITITSCCALLWYPRFRLTKHLEVAWVYNNKIKWLGQKGYFQGVASEVVPQISKVADNIYFFSWSTGSAADNVVHNYNTMRVNAHLSESQVKDALWQIHGDVYNINSPESVFPHSQLTPVEDVGKILKKNIAQKNLPPFAFTAATKIADGIYFISWEKGADSDHIVVNRNSMTVFDHVSPTGERKEAIYNITYFGAK